MILCDFQISNYCQTINLVKPFDPKLLNGASIDVRLGYSLKLLKAKGFIDQPLFKGSTKENPYRLQPNDRVLACTLEEFNFPLSIAGNFFLKSSRAREFLEHLHAGFIDPGYTGAHLTLELKNEDQYSVKPLYPGMRIGQVVFYQMASLPTIDYSVVGHYNHDKEATQSKLSS